MFVETKRAADAIEDFLCGRDFKSTSIHGDRTQAERETALRNFKTHRTPILVATDVAARGLDIPDVALVINYPDAAEQRARIDAHAKAALLMASILLAAGVFTGIMTGSGMLKAMAAAAVSFVPADAGRQIPVALGLISMPLSLLFDPDSFYFGVLPVVAEVSKTLGGQPVQVVQAALVGQMTVGFPVSPLTPATFLVVGLSGIELGAHQRFTIPFLLAASVIMTAASVVFGVFPL